MNKNKKLRLVFILSFMWMTSIFAQETSVSNVLNIKKARQTGTIIEDDKLVGYYIFYFKEKQSKSKSTYEIEIFDDNYNSVKSTEITRPRNTYLMEMVYNGEAFMIFFYDSKTGYEFVTIDKNGNEIGKKKVLKKDISTWDIQSVAARATGDSENASIYPYGNKGFVRSSIGKNKKMGYALTAYDNQLNVLWTNESPKDSKLLETADITELNDEFIAATVYRRKSIMTKKMDLAYLLINAETGRTITELEMGTRESGKKSILKTYIDKEEDKIILLGEHFKPGDDILKDKSQGIFVMEIDENGKKQRYKEFDWKGKIDQFKSKNLSAEDQKEAKNSYSLYFHNVVRTEDGGLFLIAEQYKKQVSAGGLALKAAAGLISGATGATATSDAAAMEIRIGNMVVIQIDKNLDLKNYEIVSKKKSSVMLQQGMGIYGTAFLGHYVKTMGGFDYSFTSLNEEKNDYLIAYTDHDRKEKKGAKKSDVMLGVIRMKDNEMTATRVPINAESKWFWIQPAKTGYISISEYYKKEKRLDMRLEKLVY